MGNRRDFIKTTGLTAIAAYIPFSPAPRPIVVAVEKTKYDDYEVFDWLQCRLVLFNHRNKPIHSPKITAAHAGMQDFPIMLMSFYRVTEPVQITAVQFVDKDDKVPFKPIPFKVCLTNNDTFQCNYRMERP